MEKGDTYKPQRLWFIDKVTGKKVVVDAERTTNGKISFLYQGKRYVIPVSMLGNRIYACLPERPQKKEMLKREIFYQGEYFERKNGQWVSSNGNIPKDKYQSKLSNLYQKRHKHYNHPAKELTVFARKQKKDVDGINTTIRALEIAMLRASAEEAKGFLATLCSLYRQTGSSNAAAALYEYSAKKYGKQIESVPFLTSAAAAFMDIGNIGMAGSLRNKALARSGKNDENLAGFGRRFDAETRLD